MSLLLCVGVRAGVRLFTLFIPVYMYVRTCLFCALVKVRLRAGAPQMSLFSIAECKHRTAEGIFCSVSIQQDVQLSRPDLDY